MQSGGLPMPLDQLPCTLYLIRHAESEVNAQLGVPAQYVRGGSPLTQRGRQQAADLARRFRQLPIVHVYASDSVRAHQTALILAIDHPISTSPLLRERRDPASTEPETDAEAVARLTMILKDIVRQHRGESVAVVSHGYVMRTLLVALGFATFDELPGGAIAHSGYIQFISDGEHFSIGEMDGVHTRA
jgi:broad specificity phosphatase PhoE